MLRINHWFCLIPVLNKKNIWDMQITETCIDIKISTLNKEDNKDIKRSSKENHTELKIPEERTLSLPDKSCDAGIGGGVDVCFQSIF
jgi:hypothetical protein